MSHSSEKITFPASRGHALAAALHQKIDTQGRSIGIVVSGGNVDARLYCDCLQRYPAP
jgi:threonine dehydratase